MARAWVAIAACAVAVSGAGAGCGAGAKQVRLAPDSKCASLDACAAECEGGGAAACRRLAQRYDSGNGVATDEARALELYRRACDGGDALGCDLGASTIALTGEAAALPLYRRAVALYQGACDAGNNAACGDLGVMVENGRGGLKKDPPRAVALYRRACDAGGQDGCFYLGMAYDDGLGVAHSNAEAARWYERSCELGSPDACGMAANFHDDGSLDCDVDKARELRTRGAEGYEQQCEEGDDWGCWSAASEWDLGVGMPEDDQRATDLLTKGCSRNGKHSCSELAGRLEIGEGVATDRERALELHRKACELGEDDSCLGAWRLLAALGRVEEAETYAQRALASRDKGCRRGAGSGIWCQRVAEMYEKGQGVKIDKDKAADYTRRAAEARKRRCLEGAGWECGQAGQTYADGRGVPADPVLAADMWRRACERTPYYCTEAGERFEQGKGVAADKAAAIAAYQHGCDFDISRSCLLLSKLVEDPARSEAVQNYNRLNVTCEHPEYGDDGDGDGDGDDDGDNDDEPDGD